MIAPVQIVPGTIVTYSGERKSWRDRTWVVLGAPRPGSSEECGDGFMVPVARSESDDGYDTVSANMPLVMLTVVGETAGGK